MNTNDAAKTTAALETEAAACRLIWWNRRSTKQQLEAANARLAEIGAALASR